MRKICLLTAFLICLSTIGESKAFNYFDVFDSQQKDPTVSIDACDLDPYSDKEEKVSSPLERPQKLYHLTEQGPSELKYIGTKRVHVSVCDLKLPRNLWVFESPVKIDTHPLIVDGPNFKLKTFKEEFKTVDLSEKDWEKLSSLNGRKKWGHKGNNTCNAYSAKDFIRLECEYSVYLFKEFKLFLEYSDPDDSSSNLKLVGEVEISSEIYYYVVFSSSQLSPKVGNKTSLLKSMSGKEIHPTGCSLPQKC